MSTIHSVRMRWICSFLVMAVLSNAPPATAQSTWLWPFTSVTLVRGFDPPAQPWLPGHRGIDLQAPPGTKVHAVNSGVISFRGLVGGKPVVVVSHGAVRSTYEPVSSSLRAGERVLAGDVIGTLEAGHCQMGCLHLGLRRGDHYIDPRVVLASARLISGSPARG